MTTMFFQKNKNLFFLIGLLVVGLFACVKTEFDEPPAGGEPITLTPTTTIAELKKLHISKGGFDKVTNDLIIGGEVVMDDRSGNYYKTLVIEDASGGIEVKFNDGFLYQQYPIGRKIYIRCKDLLLSDYNGMPQLTGSIVVENGVQSGVGLTLAQTRQKVVKGEYATTLLAPKKVKLSDIKNTALLGTLIQLDGVQFVPCDAGKTYADVTTKNSLNRILEDCTGAEAILRSSGYADFAASKTAVGNGTIVGVLGVYNTDYQLYIRNTDDVKMTNPRCGGSGGSGGTLTDISKIRSVFTGTTTAAPANTKIKGIVISDRYANNLNSKNVYIQDASGGILVRFAAAHCFDLGDEVEVEVSNQELSEFNKLLQVNNVPLAYATIVGSGNTPTVRTATIAEINANADAWESTLVKITGATISGGGTPISGSKTVTDATGSITMFTQSSAAFSAITTPSTAVTVTAIVSDFNGKQIILRNATDLQ